MMLVQPLIWCGRSKKKLALSNCCCIIRWCEIRDPLLVEFFQLKPCHIMKRLAIFLMIMVVATTFLPAQDTITLPGDGTHVINPIDEFPSEGNILIGSIGPSIPGSVFLRCCFSTRCAGGCIPGHSTKGDYSVFTNIARFLDRIRLFKIFPFKE
jgi:hypothetical protein